MRRLLVPGILAGLFVLELASVSSKTLTADEPTHYEYGRRILRLDSDRFDNSKMPSTAWNALPCRASEVIPPGVVADALCRPTTARMMTTLFSLVVAFVVYRWSSALYGPPAGILSLVLYALDPNVLAHGQLITTDLYAAGSIALATWAFWRFVEAGGWRRCLLAGAAMGLAQVAKYTGAYLYPIFLVIVLLRHGDSLWRLLREGRRAEAGRKLGVFGAWSALYVSVGLLVINAAFLFNHPFMPLSEYRFRSPLFVSLQERLAPLPCLRVPVPYPYFEGLDWVKDADRHGYSNGNLYLLGRFKGRGEQPRGFKGYFFYVSLFKVPLAMFGLIGWALVCVARRRDWDRFRRAELYLLAPVAFFTVYFNFFFGTHIGFRYFLVVMPFLHVLCGALLADASRKRARAVAVLAAAVAVSVLAQFPHFLSYMNELLWDRKDAYKLLADSNLDWGQDRMYLKRWRKEHPGTILSPPRPTAGRIVVSINQLVGVINRRRYKWLRENFEPVDHIAGSYLVYDVKREDLERLGLAPPP